MTITAKLLTATLFGLALSATSLSTAAYAQTPGLPGASPWRVYVDYTGTTGNPGTNPCYVDVSESQTAGCPMPNPGVAGALNAKAEAFGGAVSLSDSNSNLLATMSGVLVVDPIQNDVLAVVNQVKAADPADAGKCTAFIVENKPVNSGDKTQGQPAC
jgi:hypothetical protein